MGNHHGHAVPGRSAFPFFTADGASACGEARALFEHTFPAVAGWLLALSVPQRSSSVLVVVDTACAHGARLVRHLLARAPNASSREGFRKEAIFHALAPLRVVRDAMIAAEEETPAVFTEPLAPGSIRVLIVGLHGTCATAFTPPPNLSKGGTA